MSQLVSDNFERVPAIGASSFRSVKVVPNELTHKNNSFPGKVTKGFDTFHETAFCDEVLVVWHEVNAIWEAMLNG